MQARISSLPSNRPFSRTPTDPKYARWAGLAFSKSWPRGWLSSGFSDLNSRQAGASEWSIREHSPHLPCARRPHAPRAGRAAKRGTGQRVAIGPAAGHVAGGGGATLADSRGKRTGAHRKSWPGAHLPHRTERIFSYGTVD